MSHSRTHPDDATLILALDRELSFAQRAAVNQHLTACDACRARLTAFQDVAHQSTRVYREGSADDAAGTVAVRRRLQQRMETLASEWDRSLLFRLQRTVGVMPGVAHIIILVALLTVGARLLLPGSQTASPTVPSPTQSLPIARFTPGATSPASAQDLCSGAVPARRVVRTAVRQDVLQKYQMAHVAPSEYELDYLITPELGGVGDAQNLWPQRYEAGMWNARVKDDLESLLPRLMCAGTVDLAMAQREIAGNWIDAYKKYFKTDRPMPRQAAVIDDDEEIEFTDAAYVEPSGSRLVSFARPPIVIPARFAPIDALAMVRSRNLGQ
jgi:anti-sigma factor RsiW